MLATVHSMVVNLIGNGQSYITMLTKAEEGTKSLTKTIQGSFIALDQFNQLMKGINKDVTQALGGTSIIGAFSEFDHAFTQSTAIMKLNEKQMTSMKSQALSLSKTLPIAPTRFAEAYFFLASAGYKAEEAIQALPIIANFATAGIMDLAKATTLAADAQSALGLRTGNLAQDMRNLKLVTDVLVEANVLANANVEQFSMALTRGAGSSLKIFGKSIEEGVAVLAAMADQGIKAEIAGTSLQRVLLLLSRAAVKNKDGLRKYNIEVFDSAGRMRNIADIIGDMERAFADMSDQTRTSALEQIGFQARVQGAVLPLIGTSNKIREYQKALEEAGGATERIATKQLASFSNQMQILRNKLLTVAIDIGSIVTPAILSMTYYVGKAADWWASLTMETKRSIVVLTSMGISFMAFIPILRIISKMFSFLPSPMAVLLKSSIYLQGVFLSLLNPIRLLSNIFSTIGRSVFSVFLITKLWFSPTFIILRTVLSIGAALVVWIQRMGGIEEAWRKVEFWVASIWEWIVPIRDAMQSMFKVVAEKGIRLLIRVTEKAGQIMLDTLSWVGGYIQIPWQKVQKVIVTAIKLVEMFARNSLEIWNYFSRIVVNLLTPVIEKIVEVGLASWQAFKTFTVANLGTIVGIIALVSIIRSLISVYTVLYSVISTVITFISSLRLATLAYNAVLGIARVGLIAYKTALIVLSVATWILKSAMIGLTVGFGTFGLGVQVATAVVWLFNSAIAALPILLIGGLIYGLTTGITYLVGSIAGAIQALKSLFSVMSIFPSKISDDVDNLTGLFKEWGNVIGVVAHALTVDMDIAWKLAKKGVEIFLADFKEMWPHVWEFVTKGFKILGRTLSDTFQYTFLKIEMQALSLGMRIATLGFGSAKAVAKMQEEIASIDNRIEELQKGGAEKLGNVFNDMTKKLKVGKVGKDLRKEFTDLMDELELAQIIQNFDAEYDKALRESMEKNAEVMQKKTEELYTKVGKGAGAGVAEGLKSNLKEFNAVLFGSAEAMRRLDEYNAILNEQNKGVKKKPQDPFDFNRVIGWGQTIGGGFMKGVGDFNNQQQFFTPGGFTDVMNLIFAGGKKALEDDFKRKMLSNANAQMLIFEARQAKYNQELDTWLKATPIIEKMSASGSGAWKDIFGAENIPPMPAAPDKPDFTASAEPKKDTELLKEIRDALVAMEKNGRIGESGILFPANLG